GGGRVDGSAAGHAEHRRRLLRRGDLDGDGALRGTRRTGASGRHGHRDRGAAARALYAALPAQLRAHVTEPSGRQEGTESMPELNTPSQFDAESPELG